MPDTARPAVSVLMAVYNCARFVERAVASVLAQTLKDFEFVLVDDGSTDESPAILRRLAAQDPRIILHHQTNRGIGGAMNKALALARAPLVAILDSDDLMRPARLATQVAWMEAHPEVAAAGSQFYTIDTEDQVTGLDRHPTDPTLATDLMFGFFCLHHPTLIARRDALLEAGGYAETHRRGCPDYGLFMELVLHGHRLSNLPQVLTSWRHTPTGATFGHAREQTTDALEIRARGFARHARQAPAAARAAALTLARRFGAGTELDQKAHWLGLTSDTQPAVKTLLGNPGDASLSAIEEAALRWLNDGKSADMREWLQRAGYPWLASLLGAQENARAEVEIPVVGLALGEVAEPGLLSVLLPVEAQSLIEMPARIERQLALLPAHSELLIFAVDADSALPGEMPADPRLRILRPQARCPAARWTEALRNARGEYLAALEWSGAHAPGFLAEARKLLQSRPGLELVHASSSLYFPDALDDAGRPLADPAPEPRWTRETLLGRQRVRLQDLVLRRNALTRVPIAPAECGSELPRLLAHALLLYGESAALALRNQAFTPQAGEGAAPMSLATDRLVRGYLDSCEGLIPPRGQWSTLGADGWRQRLERLDEYAVQGRLPVHPGNLALLLDFIIDGPSSPLLRLSLRRLLRSHRVPTLEALRRRGTTAVLCARGWSLLQRLLARVGFVAG